MYLRAHFLKALFLLTLSHSAFAITVRVVLPNTFVGNTTREVMIAGEVELHGEQLSVDKVHFEPALPFFMTLSPEASDSLFRFYQEAVYTAFAAMRLKAQLVAIQKKIQAPNLAVQIGNIVTHEMPFDFSTTAEPQKSYVRKMKVIKDGTTIHEVLAETDEGLISLRRLRRQVHSLNPWTNLNWLVQKGAGNGRGISEWDLLNAQESATREEKIPPLSEAEKEKIANALGWGCTGMILLAGAGALGICSGSAYLVFSWLF